MLPVLQLQIQSEHHVHDQLISEQTTGYWQTEYTDENQSHYYKFTKAYCWTLHDQAVINLEWLLLY